MIDNHEPAPDSESLCTNPPGPIFWSATCPLSRVEGIMRAQEIISRFGYILDFRHFSDLEMSLVLEIAESNMAALYIELTGIMDLKSVKGKLTGKEQERRLLINIAFTSGEGLLRTDVPAV
jgi:hypothetical protein